MEITPGTLSKSDSTHQKQPPAKIALSAFAGGADFAAGVCAVVLNAANALIANTDAAATVARGEEKN